MTVVLLLFKMADSSERSRRAVALEEKKRRLEELKARRAATSEDATTKSSGTGGGLDDYIDTLLSSSAPVIKSKQEDDVEGETNKEAPKTLITPAKQPISQKPMEESKSIAPVLSIPLVETITTWTQTDEDDFPPPSIEDSELEVEEQLEKQAEEAKVEDGDADNMSKGTQTMINFHLLTKEERIKAISAAPFGNFITSASKKVERLLEHETTWLDISYAPQDDFDIEDDEEKQQEDKAITKGLLTGTRFTLECPKWTRTRCVTDLDWSPLHKELMVTSYHELGSTTNRSTEKDNIHAAPIVTPTTANTPSTFVSAQPYEALNVDGLACVWSLHMPHRPEHLFTSASAVSAVKFHPAAHHLVVGGCENGQLMLWDMRNGRLPVQKSTLSVSSKNTNHAFKICSLQVAQGGVSVHVQRV